MLNETKTDWWHSFYEETPFELYLKREDQSNLTREIAFLKKHLQLSLGDTVLDQCCGCGAMSIPMAKQGISVLGIDLSKRLTTLAREKADEERLSNCHFVVADAFTFVPDNKCDAAFNWWTSFGYADHKRNLDMLKRVFQSLKPGKYFALDYPNTNHLLKYQSNFQEIFQNTEHGQIKITKKTKLNQDAKLREQKWTYELPDGQVISYDTSICLYSPTDLANMLEEVGFTAIETYGNIDEDIISNDSQRCISIARRPV